MTERRFLTATIVTLNEEANLGRCLESLRGLADEVIVVDSGSIDRTLPIAEAGKARVFTHPWEGYGQQKNFAQSRATHDWILNLDADEAVSPELAAEIRILLSRDDRDLCAGYTLPRLSWYLGRWIRHGGWYPNRLVRLADRRHARWTEPKVHEALEVQGKVGALNADLYHYPFSTIRDQIETNLRYAGLGTQELARKGRRFSRWKIFWKPIGKFIETYWLKGGWLDGAPGFIISVNAAHSIFLKYATLIERRSGGSREDSPDR